MCYIALYCRDAQPLFHPAAEKQDWGVNVAASQIWNNAIFSQQKPVGWIKVLLCFVTSDLKLAYTCV